MRKVNLENKHRYENAFTNISLLLNDIEKKNRKILQLRFHRVIVRLTFRYKCVAKRSIKFSKKYLHRKITFATLLQRLSGVKVSIKERSTNIYNS